METSVKVKNRKNFASNFWWQDQRKIAPYIFVSPFFILFTIFWAIPILFSFYLGFTEWDANSVPKFIGLQNYLRLPQDPVFIKSLVNTIFFVVVYNLIMFSIALPIALLLEEGRIRFRNFFRTMYFLPVTVALAVTALIFSMILSKDYGLLNLLLQWIGFQELPNWLRDVKLAMWSLIGMRVWRVTGYYMVFIIAGLQAINHELYDAAQVDGASTLQRIWHVTLPQLRPIMLFVLVLSSLWAFQTFEEPWILTRGGPANSTLTLVQYLYMNGFMYAKFGYSAAISYVLTLLMMIVSIAQVKFLTRGDED